MSQSSCLLLSRPLAYSTLADLVHHVRQNLPLTDLSLAVQLFAKNIDDESLPSNIQTMSCKLLLNLVDCIRSKSEQENGNGRDILMRMLEVGGGLVGLIQRKLIGEVIEVEMLSVSLLFTNATGICAEVPHDSSLPACVHLQEVQAPVRDGRGRFGGITWGTGHSHSIYHPCYSPACTSHARPCGTSPTDHVLRQTGRERGQADVSGVGLPQPGEDPGVRGEDDHMGHHLLQGTWR